MSYNTFSLASLPLFPLLSLLTIVGFSSGLGSVVLAQSDPLSFGEDRLPSDRNSSNIPLTVQSINPPGISSFNPNAALGRYVVSVNGGSDLLLEQVRRIEPGAFRRNEGGRSVIQVGRFVSRANAQDLTTVLERQGILAQIETLADTTAAAVGSIGGDGSTFTTDPLPLDTTGIVSNLNANLTTLDFAAPIASSGDVAPLSSVIPFTAQSQIRSYYVAIPVRPSQLSSVSSEIAATGINPANILLKGSHRGAFIAIGPFNSRLDATVMEGTLKASGFGNARVYYGY